MTVLAELVDLVKLCRDLDERGAPWPAHDEAGRLGSMEAVATVQIKLDIPAHLADLAFPEALDRRLHTLLDKQDQGERLSEEIAASGAAKERNDCQGQVRFVLPDVLAHT
jgi:hypothetical protein